jgi:hypothetical protein
MIKIDCSFIFSLFENIFHYNVLFIILLEQVVERQAKIAQIIFNLFQTKNSFHNRICMIRIEQGADKGGESI